MEFVQNSLRGKNMIIFLYGEDSYRSHQKLNEIIEHYKEIHKSGLNLRFFDCEEQEVTVSDLKEKIRQASMFKEKKLVVITNLFKDPNLKEKILEEIKELSESDDIIVIYEQTEIKKTDPLLKFLEKNAKSQDFKILDSQNLKKWVKNEIESRRGSIDENILSLLIDYVGNDLWQMANEIQKLLSYKKNKAITAGDLKLLVKPKIETDIFRTIDAIAQKNKKQALDLLYKHLEAGDSPLYLLSMVGYQFRNLLIVKDLIEKNKPYNIIVKKSGLHPFVVKKSYLQSRQFTFPELKKIYQRIFQVDLDVKTGKIEQEMALDLLVAEI